MIPSPCIGIQTAHRSTGQSGRRACERAVVVCWTGASPALLRDSIYGRSLRCSRTHWRSVHQELKQWLLHVPILLSIQRNASKNRFEKTSSSQVRFAYTLHTPP